MSRPAPVQPWWGHLRSWRLWTSALTAAAVMAVLVTLGPGSKSETPDFTRDAGIEIVTPTAQTRNPSEVEWKTDLDVTRFRVELVDMAGAALFRTDTGALRVVIPADVLAKMKPGGRYTWKVTALDAVGRPVTITSRTFAVEGDGR